jgi:muramoyltetrapeptide carboxypeptidase
MLFAVTLGFQPLRRGEPIGVVALSGPVTDERLDAGLAALASWGHPLVEAPNLRSRRGYLAGDDEARLAGLDVLLDRGVRTIVAARGGYGSTRLLERLPWRRLAASGVCLVGHSDLTAVIAPLAASGVPQVHGPMVAAGLARTSNARRLHSVLAGELVGRPLFRFREAAVVRSGAATGRAVGGNLATLAALAGTGREPDLDGAVLFLEEVNEPAYRIDRMLTQLAASARLEQVVAVVGGSLVGCRPASTRERLWQGLLLELAPPRAVVVTGLPFGHGADNRAFPLGVPVEVDTDAGVVRWSEAW